MRRTEIQRRLTAEQRRIQDNLARVCAIELARLWRSTRLRIQRINAIRPKTRPQRVNLSKAFVASDSPWDIFTERMRRRLIDELKRGALSLSVLNAMLVLGEGWEAKGWEFDTDQFVRMIEPELATRITHVSRTLKRQVARHITAWYNSPDVSMQAVVDILRPAFGTERAALIAQNEITTLDSAVQERMANVMGIQEWWWMTKRDQIVCRSPLVGPDGRKYNGCRELHGKKFTIGQPMPPKGSHIGCRCSTRLISRPAKQMLEEAPPIVDTSHLVKADFREDQHPRDKDGKFAPKGSGSNTGGKMKSPPAKSEIADLSMHPDIVAFRKKKYSKALTAIVGKLYDATLYMTAAEEHSLINRIESDVLDDSVDLRDTLKFIRGVYLSSKHNIGDADQKTIDNMFTALRIAEIRAIKKLKYETKPVPVAPAKHPYRLVSREESKKGHRWDVYHDDDKDRQVEIDEGNSGDWIEMITANNGTITVEHCLPTGVRKYITSTGNVKYARTAGERVIESAMVEASPMKWDRVGVDTFRASDGDNTYYIAADDDRSFFNLKIIDSIGDATHDHFTSMKDALAQAQNLYDAHAKMVAKPVVVTPAGDKEPEYAPDFIEWEEYGSEDLFASDGDRVADITRSADGRWSTITHIKGAADEDWSTFDTLEDAKSHGENFLSAGRPRRAGPVPPPKITDITKKVMVADKPFYMAHEAHKNMVESSINRTIESYAKSHGKTATATKNLLLKNLNKMTSGKVCKRIWEKDLIRVLTDPEHRLKTQFETGHSDGAFAPDYRRKAEYKGMGAPNDLDPRMRPIYGYIPQTTDYTGHYGNIRLVFKDSVRKRTTFTVGDSLGMFASDEVIATPVTHPGIGSSDNQIEDIAFRGGIGHASYLECQITGGATMFEVEEVVFHRNCFQMSGKLKPECEEAEKMLKKLGYKVTYAEHEG